MRKKENAKILHTENISFTSHPALLSNSRPNSTSPLLQPLSNSNDHGSNSLSSGRVPLHLEMAVSVWKVSFVADLRKKRRKQEEKKMR